MGEFVNRAPLPLARIMHRFWSRSGESAGLTWRGDRGPRKRTVGYAEEADGVGTRFAGRTVRPSAFGDAVENLCIFRALFLLAFTAHSPLTDGSSASARSGWLQPSQKKLRSPYIVPFIGFLGAKALSTILKTFGN